MNLEKTGNRSDKTQQVVKLSVPMHYTEGFLEELSVIERTYADQVRVGEVFGCIPDTSIGSLRPARLLSPVTISDFPKFVDQAHRFGYEFNYTMNAMFMDGSEHTTEGIRRICDLLEKLSKAGIDRITVAVPFLVLIVKRHFPSIKVSASICCEVATWNRAKQFVDMGVDRIVVSRDINRDFESLTELVENSGVSIEVLATSPCLLQCANVFYHGNLSTLESGAFEGMCAKPADELAIPVAVCIYSRIAEPWLLISSPWIRPEDISYYKNIGIHNFKLDGRDKPSAFVLEVARSYLQQRHEGNLLRLIQPYYPKTVDEVFEPKSNDDSFMAIALDNRSLDDFIKPFANLQIICRGQCYKCNYCKVIAKKVVTCNELWRKQFLNRWCKKWIGASYIPNIH